MLELTESASIYSRFDGLELWVRSVEWESRFNIH